MNLRNIAKKHEAFLGNEYQVYFTPGRVNLIGEHIDYEGGRVFPIAINLGTYAFVSKRQDSEFHFLSDNYMEFGTKIIKYNNLRSSIRKTNIISSEKSEKQENRKSSHFSSFLEDENFDREYNSPSNSIYDLNFYNADGWVNFPKGIIKYFLQAGADIPSGLNILIYGNLPKASGLSSSASLEVLISLVLKYEYSINTDLSEIANICKYVENKYMNVNCGIMDQFAVAMSKENHALYLDTSSLVYDYIPLYTGDYSFIITNTNKSRSLADSKYNERVEQCNIAKILINKNIKKLDYICDLSPEDFYDNLSIFNDKIIANRVEHIITENDRTKQAVLALKQKDMIKFGDLMNKSHDSLRYLYEVSCNELDTLVNSFRRHGAIGSRMTGAGFGGCTISLVKTSHIDEIITKVKADYLKEIGYNASFYPVKACDGAKKLESEDIL